MSWQPAVDPSCEGAEAPRGVETVIVPRARDLGGFEVRRALPATQRQMVGPFIFFDQMGPVEFLAGRGLDVRPHPHIGLATVTYLFEGEILHRDSLGTAQPIRPGDVNWMTAGRGIAHSERTDPAQRAPRQPPVRHPDLGGAAQGRTRRPPRPSPTTRPRRCRCWRATACGAADRRRGLGRPLAGRDGLADCSTPTRCSRPGRAAAADAGHEERGAYVGARRGRGRRHVLRGRADAAVPRRRPAGAAGAGPRARGCCCWAARRWTARGSSVLELRPPRRERIEQAKADWQAGRFGKVPGDEKEFIPLPEERVRAEPAARVSDGSPTS